VFRHIFTDPRTTKKESPGSSAGPATKVKIYKIIQVTPEMIMYAYVQARFAISSQESWSLTDGDFNSITFYNAVITMIDMAGDSASNSEKKFCLDILSYYNQ
ncbi:hypothetical protein C8Q75DRAFT_716104, partial [Abortiporus biennis]